MNLRNVLRTYALLRQLSDDESALLATLRAMSDTERELLVESLQPEKSSGKKKSSKKATSGGKSQRASNMAATSGKNRQSQEPRCVVCYEVLDHANHGTGEGQHLFETSVSERAIQQLKKHEPKCQFTVDDKTCLGAEGDAIHDATMGYGGYHEFQPEQAAAAGGD